MLEEWSFTLAEEFVQRVDEILTTLKGGSVSYQASNYNEIFICVVCKQITLYYKEKGTSEIELVRFRNNFHDKSKLGFD